MSLFIVQHKHSAETCPAKDKEMAPQLLAHLSRANAEKFGVKILSEAVVNGAHTLYLVVEASDEKTVAGYMQPFAMAGSVDVHPASHCEKVVERGFC
ncbi:MAG TPA: DUF3303 family protein [Bacteroidota bacterium]